MVLRLGLGSGYVWMKPKARIFLFISLARFILRINLFDTAQYYGNGKGEQILGLVLPSKAKIITKIGLSNAVGLENSSQERWGLHFSPKVLEEEFEASLTRLRRKSCYGLLLHCTEKDFDFKEHIEVLKKLKIAGRVEKIGFSADQEKHIPEESNWADIIQVHVSLLDKCSINNHQLLFVNGIFRNSKNEISFLEFVQRNQEIDVVALIGTHRFSRIIKLALKYIKTIIRNSEF